MNSKNKKQFGVWMDTHHATIVGREFIDSGDFVVLGHAKNDGPGANSNEAASHNLEQSLMQKYFKEITGFMQNVDELHLTGTGTAQEQLIHFLADAPQYKNAEATESTSNKMSDDKLIDYIAAKFN